MNKEWYKTSFRRNLVDMHIDDWDEDFLKDFDPQRYVDCLKKAKIRSTMIYLQSHIGLCNWDSKSGQTHRAFRNNHKIRTLIDLCHEAEMDVIVYYSLIYNNWAYETHPEWRIVDYDGRASRDNYFGKSRYGVVCPNNPEYREFLTAQFREICENYQFEGIYLDMTFWPEVCCCPSCRERFYQETGWEIPEFVDWQDPVWLRFQKARQEWIGDFAAFCTETLKKLNPDAAVIHQCSPFSSGWPQAVDEGVSNANTYVGGDFYGGHTEQSYVCKLYREATSHQPFEYQTSRCDPNLNVHTVTKTPEKLLLHNYLTLAHHGAVLFIDAIDPDGTLNPSVYRRIGEVFSKTIPYEKYMYGDLCSEAALVMSLDSKFDVFSPKSKHQPPDWNHPQLKAHLGLARILKEMRMTYTVLPGGRLERLKDKKVAFLTDAAILQEEQIEELVRWVDQGGCLYLSGTTDPRLSRKLLNLQVCGYTKTVNTYMAPTGAGEEIFGAEYSARYPLACKRQQVLVKNPDNHTVLAYMALPLTDPSDTEKFVSIHSNPPGKPSEW